jgi:hypothetical protein
MQERTCSSVQNCCQRTQEYLPRHTSQTDMKTEHTDMKTERLHLCREPSSSLAVRFRFCRARTPAINLITPAVVQHLVHDRQILFGRTRAGERSKMPHRLGVQLNVYTPFLSELIGHIGQTSFHANIKFAPGIRNMHVIALTQTSATDRRKATFRTPTLWAVIAQLRINSVNTCPRDLCS